MKRFIIDQLTNPRTSVICFLLLLWLFNFQCMIRNFNIANQELPFVLWCLLRALQDRCSSKHLFVRLFFHITLLIFIFHHFTIFFLFFFNNFIVFLVGLLVGLDRIQFVGERESTSFIFTIRSRLDLPLVQLHQVLTDHEAHPNAFAVHFSRA